MTTSEQKFDLGQALDQHKKEESETVKRGSIKAITLRLHDRISLNRQLERIGQDTGFRFLQRATYGLIPGFLWVIGGYTSVGKSALMVQLIANAIAKNPAIRIAVFSTEMSSEQILLRLVANKTTIPSLEVFRGQLSEQNDRLVNDTLNFYHGKNLWIFDDHYTFKAIQKTCQDIGKLDVIFVDFLQNIQGKGTIYDRMSVLPVQFQRMAKALNSCVVSFSQVSNESVRGGGDVIGFKGAGEIVAACDIGLWLERDKTNEDLLHCVVRKNRHGPKCKGVLRYTDRFARLVEVTNGA